MSQNFCYLMELSDAMNTSTTTYKGRFCTAGGAKAPLGYVETDPSGRYGRVSPFDILLIFSSYWFVSNRVMIFLTI